MSDNQNDEIKTTFQGPGEWRSQAAELEDEGNDSEDSGDE